MATDTRLLKIASRYPGRCRICGTNVNVGDWVLWQPGTSGVCCILRCEAPVQQPKPEPKRVQAAGLFARITQLFDHASEHGLKWPKIRLQDIDGNPVILSRCGEQSKTPGAINVKSPGAFGDAVWYGRVETDGSFRAGRDCTSSVHALVEQLADNPVSVACAYGRLTGSCCFCSRELTDARSVTVGYGPICADHFGLPWGETINPALKEETRMDWCEEHRDEPEHITAGYHDDDPESVFD